MTSYPAGGSRLRCHRRCLLAFALKFSEEIEDYSFSQNGKRRRRCGQLRSTLLKLSTEVGLYSSLHGQFRLSAASNRQHTDGNSWVCSSG